MPSNKPVETINGERYCSHHNIMHPIFEYRVRYREGKKNPEYTCKLYAKEYLAKKRAHAPTELQLKFMALPGESEEQRKDRIMRSNRMLKNYGITMADYNKMYQEQEGCCKICGRHETEFPNRLAIDHDHETGKVRSLLCSPCNVSLGGFQDSVIVVEKALKYLKDNK